MDFGERLKAKVGPLPVWAWGLLAGGLFTVWYWVSNRDSGTGTGTDSGVTDEAGTVETPSGDFSTVPVVPNENAVQDENTNQEWLVQALNAAGTAGVSFVTAQIALSKYLNGQTLTQTESGIVNKIIGVVGPPPEGTFGTPEVTPDPEEPAAPTPTATDYATVTTFSVPSKAKYGQTIAVRMNVRWAKSGQGKAPLPTAGQFVLMVGGQKYVNNDVAGSAIRIIRVKKGDKRLSGNRVIVTARYEVPSGKGYKTRGSQAAPKTIIFS